MFHYNVSLQQDAHLQYLLKLIHVIHTGSVYHPIAIDNDMSFPPGNYILEAMFSVNKQRTTSHFLSLKPILPTILPQYSGTMEQQIINSFLVTIIKMCYIRTEILCTRLTYTGFSLSYHNNQSP